MKAEEFRLNNSVMFGERVIRISHHDIANMRKMEIVEGEISMYIAIRLTEDWLIKLGFKKEPYAIITNSYYLNVGRNRVMSVACVGTPNEMVFLSDVDNSENPTKVLNVIVLKNWDYDKATYVHHLQNLHYAITGSDLTIPVSEKPLSEGA